MGVRLRVWLTDYKNASCAPQYHLWYSVSSSKYHPPVFATISAIPIPLQCKFCTFLHSLCFVLFHLSPYDSLSYCKIFRWERRGQRLLFKQLKGLFLPLRSLRWLKSASYKRDKSMIYTAIDNFYVSEEQLEDTPSRRDSVLVQAMLRRSKFSDKEKKMRLPSLSLSTEYSVSTGPSE